jgi:hypothetical protein
MISLKNPSNGVITLFCAQQPFSLSSFPYNFQILYGTVAGRQGGGREINECYSETKKNQSWAMLSGDWRRVTSPQRLKEPMK